MSSPRIEGTCPSWAMERSGPPELPAPAVRTQLAWLADHWLAPFVSRGIQPTDLLPRAGEHKSQCNAKNPNRLCPLVVVRSGQLLLQISTKSRLFSQPLAGCASNETVQGTSVRRLQTILRLLLVVLRQEPSLPDFELRVCPDDFCHGEFEGRPVPWLTMASCHTMPSLPGPSWDTSNRRNADLAHWDEVLEHRRRWRREQASRWACKESVAAWRGSLSEEFTTNMPWTSHHKLDRRPIDAATWHRAGRLALLSQWCDHPHEFNVFVAGARQLAWRINSSRLIACEHNHTHERRWDRVLSLEQQAARFKYLLHVEGVGGWADRLRHLLLSGATVVKQDMGVAEWYEPLLEAGRHFVPASSSLSNLTGAIRWARAHDAESRRIGEDGAELAEGVLAPAALLWYMRQLVVRYAMLFERGHAGRDVPPLPRNTSARFECKVAQRTDDAAASDATRCSLFELESGRSADSMQDVWDMVEAAPHESPAC